MFKVLGEAVKAVENISLTAGNTIKLAKIQVDGATFSEMIKKYSEDKAQIVEFLENGGTKEEVIAVNNEVYDEKYLMGLILASEAMIKKNKKGIKGEKGRKGRGKEVVKAQ